MWLVGPGRHRLQHRATYSGGGICESGLSLHNNHRLKAQSYLNATYSGRSICVRGFLVQVQTTGFLAGLIGEGVGGVSSMCRRV